MSASRGRLSALAVIVALFSGCSSVDKGFVADARLGCTGNETQHEPPANHDTDAPGMPSAEAALRPTLDANIEARGQGEIVELSELDDAVRVDSRVVYIATAAESRPGEWHLVNISYCE